MGIGGRLASRAARLGVDLVENAATKAEHAGERFKGLRSVFADDERPVTIENVMAGLVSAVREDEHEEDLSARDVYKAARSRRRRLGLLSFGAGPLAGVATRIVDLYCETALLCDLALLHGIDLNDRQVVANMLVLWGISDNLAEAEATMGGQAGGGSLLSAVARRARESVGPAVPAKLTKRAAVQMLWDARELVDDARKAAGTGNVGGVVFAGHRTKRLINKAEVQLGVDRVRALGAG
ncbi:MAG TPA: hypothetical protein VL988_05575 [Solirubrobacteraceae bacterium]|nr:hypothetical protein [Solirubrobacteraceae bacterium]